jgi:hypothetical protein
MKLWEMLVHPERHDRNLRHDFVIGPLRYSPLFPEKVRSYYCTRCRWNFLVGRKKVAVLDERGNPLSGFESSRRFNTFEDGPCPVLKALTADVPSETEIVEIAPWRNRSERRNLASGNIRFGPARPRPMLRVLSRLRENLGG